MTPRTHARKLALRERAREFRRAMTPAEAVLWNHLRAHQFSDLHFRRQQVIEGFIADFSCHAARLVIEVDGGVHRATAAYDAERDAILAARGLRVLRLPNERVMDDLPTCLVEIRAAADAGIARDAPLPRPLPRRAGEG
jgi:very-short-patch-repair endonuclease